MSDSLKKIYQQKCPSCGIDEVFESKGNVFLFKIPKMKAKCNHCGFRFEKEPGYFTGAMYVSYGLAILEMIIVAAIMLLFSLSIDYLIYPVALVVVLLYQFNFKMSRIIWMYLA